MSVGYSLVNYTKKERILFTHIDASTRRELAGNQASSAITTWYLLTNLGDQISFVSDTYDDWPFSSGYRNNLDDYAEITDRVVAELIEIEILRDFGNLYADSDEPETIYIRDLRNIWNQGQ